MASTGHQRPPLGQFHEDYRIGLDSLRAVAVSLVFISHLDARHFGNGVIGVDIFFVLSGYLITGVLAQEYRKSGRINLRNFYIRRTLRLMPALYLLLACCLAWYVIEPGRQPGLLGAITATATYIMNWNRIFHWMGEGFLGHTWSLAIEEQFYLIWPLALILLPRRWWLVAAIAGAIGSNAALISQALNNASFDRIYNGLDCRMGTLLVGAACALLGREARLALAPWLGVIGLLAAIGLGAILCVGDILRPIPMAMTIPPVSLLSACAILAIDARKGEWLLSFRPLVLLGRCSYGVYLWHYPILGLLEFYGLEGSAWKVFSVPLTLAIAGASFRYVERPLLRLKDRFAASEGRLGQEQPHSSRS